MVSSHAGTRLPIAVIQSTGSSPSARRRLSASAVNTSFQIRSRGPFWSFRLKQGKKQEPPDLTPPQESIYGFLRRHYPHQVKGSKFNHFLSACFTSSPVLNYFNKNKSGCQQHDLNRICLPAQTKPEEVTERMIDYGQNTAQKKWRC